ncbi:KilA domain-containing protein [Kosakonia sp. AG348]|nr:KilA domain-containing protein [Kosakonia sp. AG348]
MKYPTVAVNGISVRVDEAGRYNLNDLHAAAVAEGKATESQRPSNFIKSGQVKKFVQELTKATKIASVKIIKGGV